MLKHNLSENTQVPIHAHHLEADSQGITCYSYLGIAEGEFVCVECSDDAEIYRVM